MSMSNKGDIGASGSSSKGALSAAAKLREQGAFALDATVQNDPKYKKYAQQVEKCLASFEAMHEWPDFIAFLKQLLKALQSYTQFKEIPRKLIVAKRLSQCLIPALPSGVHQRALDVYSHILSVLGPDGLKRDLPLWSSGLFPFFEYAATNVKPVLLGLFEKYYVPLQGELRPIMRAFILALMPGLEEETSETFEQVLGLLDRLSGAVAPAFFLQNIWLVMLTTQVPRAYCLSYLSRRLPRLDAKEDIAPIVGRDIGLMLRAFAAALGDDNLLVQRGALDLLLSTLRLEGSALSAASPTDRSLLMRAATGVVLRRDLSLNRRLFAWLLGSDEHSEKQAEYFQAHARSLLVDTLREEMFHPSSEYSATRPFKIYISLLDKWEIGTPLTEVLIHDALKSIRGSVKESTDGGEDILVTANTLYEAVEPRATWKQLFKAARGEVAEKTSETECIEMLLFVLTTFRMDDDEVQKLHLPLIFCALAEKLQELSRKDPHRVTTSTFRTAMQLLERTLEHISITAMSGPLHLPGFAFGGSFDDAACTFYGISDNGCTESVTCESEQGVTISPDTPETEKERRIASAIPFVASFERLSELTATCAEMCVGDEVEEKEEFPQTNTMHLAFVLGVTLLLKLTDALDKTAHTSGALPLTLSWDAERWFNRISRPLDLKSCSFEGADRVVSLAIRLHATPALSPTPSIDNRPRLLAMMQSLMAYLRFETSPYHVRAVRLIWDLEHATTHRHLEAIISQSLVGDTAQTGFEAYGAFGVLWRLSDDNQQPGVHFKVPMLIVLDSLKSSDPVLRRVGETWMRCNLRSYPRVLDPILLELLDPTIRQTPSVVTMNGREIRGFTYDRPFDQHRVVYLLDVLLQVARYGGQNFNRVVSTTLVSRSPCPQLLERISQRGYIGANVTYANVFVELLTRFLQSEPRPSLLKPMKRLNTEIHSTVIDLMQSVISRGDLDQPTIGSLESAITFKLFALVHSQRLELQNKLLHLLHSIISSSVAYSDRQRAKSPNLSLRNSTDPDSATEDGVTQPLAASASTNSLFVQLLIDGIATPSNRPLLHHWLDFVLLTVPQFPHVLTSAVFPLNTCACRQIRKALRDLSSVLSTTQEPSQVKSCVDDAEFVMLLNALERLILLGLDELDSTITEETSSPDKSSADTSGLLSMVSNVFLTDSPNVAAEAPMTARSPGYRALREGVGVLYETWNLVSADIPGSHPASETLSLIFTQTFSRCRRALERLYRAHAFEVIESVIERWNIDQENHKTGNAAFDIVDFLTASAQNVVHMVCESISWRIGPTAERSRKQVLNPELTDFLLLTFLEEYLSKLESPLALQVWARYLSLAKDVAANVKEYRIQAFPVLRCTTVLALKMTQTIAFEDRKIRKDIQDTYGKLLDACVLLSGKSLDQGIWPRRTKESLINGAGVPLSRTQSETNLHEKYNTPPGSSGEVSQKSPVVDLTDRINQYLAYDVLPNLRRFLVESDKITAACNNIVYYVLNPALRSKSGITDIDDIYIAIMEQMSKIPAALKSWRSPATDIFNDAKFFTMTPASGLRWRPIVKSLIDADKAAFIELLSKITSTSSANIFVNREYEMQMRAQNIRRLSFVLFASEKNHFLTQLPAIQEKLVDLLRNGGAPIVESEVYLCIRVLICRLSPHNLSSFWPVLLSELIRIFSQVMAEAPSDGSDALQAVLAACKLIDLLLVMQTEEFQIHQWIFITDTVDAIYRPDDWFPEAIMDQLSEMVGDLPASDSRGRQTSGFRLPDSVSSAGARQPLLSSVKQIDSIRDLAPFFAHLSIMSFEGVYASGGAVDWEAVESSLVMDIFDGR
ncbi:hypothetical protein ACEPAF_4066 [Sanghuangporus sanghuang]